MPVSPPIAASGLKKARLSRRSCRRAVESRAGGLGFDRDCAKMDAQARVRRIYVRAPPQFRFAFVSRCFAFVSPRFAHFCAKGRCSLRTVDITADMTAAITADTPAAQSDAPPDFR